MDNPFKEDYPAEVSEVMKKLLDSLVADIRFDIEFGTIGDVLNGIDYNRMMKFKDLKTFHEQCGGKGLDEFQVSEIIGAAIALAYSDAFL
ncbi:hypothetical protein [Sporosarcina sp. FSL K6-3457]|uniref:hypothetical protein n=1 Tax=Sporosarcina sp. FSL K6-3457 TaxID=2978204 RepID=UPI0030FD1947